MSKFIIKGGNKLTGEIEVYGAKNDVLPAIAATILTKEKCVLKNVPRLSDVEKLVEIMKSLGAEISWTGERELSVCCRELSLGDLDSGLVAHMRGSVLLMGPMLARLGAISLPEPGGDIIGKRPLDDHFSVFEAMGAKVEVEESCVRVSGKIHASADILPVFSVTATENALMAAAGTPGETTVRLAAAEPHVQNLCRMLVKMGARIEGIGTHTLTIRGKSGLGGCEHEIIPDMLEAGTFLVAFAATRGEGVIRNAPIGDLDIVLNLVREIGVKAEVSGNSIKVKSSGELKPFRIQTLPYPGFATDLQAPFAVLATQAAGMSLIHDPMYEGRLNHVPWLVKMGANALACDPHRAVISGPTPLRGYEIKALDIRSGATMVIAGLVAKGKTVVHDAEILDRGYERLAERLAALGADIRREV